MSQGGWAAPVAVGPVDAVVRVPGSKSVTNRALVLAAQAAGESVIRRPLRSRDTLLMVDALRTLGVRIDEADDDWLVTGGLFCDPADQPPSVDVDVGNAGTVLRFVPPLTGVTRRTVCFDGDSAVRRRPIGQLLSALSRLGIRIAGESVPFTVFGTGSVSGGRVEVDASASSQLVSALLLAGPSWQRGVQLRHTGDRPVPNAPHLQMTVEMLRDRGIDVDASESEWSVQPGVLRPVSETVEPDLSSAAPFLAAAVVTGGRVRLLDWPATTTQPGGRLPELLTAFGASAGRDGNDLVITGDGTINSVDLDLRDGGELTPVLAALAALADGPSRLHGIDYLRGHETDRLAALARELGSLGAKVDVEDDGLRIVPKPLRGNGFSSHDDHRMVMAGAVLGLVVPGVLVDDVATVGKTFPEFAEQWTAMVDHGQVGR